MSHEYFTSGKKFSVKQQYEILLKYCSFWAMLKYNAFNLL